MARKTKDEALVTRERILDAAEHLFQSRGVSATSLHQIAVATGVTRGAVYWHFKDKAALFDAMLGRVTLPIEAASAAQLDGGNGGSPLTRLRQHLAALFASIEGDPHVQRVFDIVTTRVEYVDDLGTLGERQAQSRRHYLLRLQGVLEDARHSGEIRTAAPARPLAVGLFALIDGLIRNWVLEPAAYPLTSTGLQAVEHYLAGLATEPRARPAAAAVKPGRVTPAKSL